MMELLIKIVITIVILFLTTKVIFWTWKSHIDPIASMKKVFYSEPKISEVLATRDPKKLYRNGKEVGDITSDVNITNKTITFKQIANCSDLTVGAMIEYQRFKLEIKQIGTMIGIKSEVSLNETKVLQNVREDVVCEIRE